MYVPYTTLREVNLSLGHLHVVQQQCATNVTKDFLYRHTATRIVNCNLSMTTPRLRSPRLKHRLSEDVVLAVEEVSTHLFSLINCQKTV